MCIRDRTHGEGLSRSRLRKERAVANTAQAGGEAAKGNNEATTVQRVSAAGTYEEDVSDGKERGSTANGFPDGPGSGLRRYGHGGVPRHRLGNVT